MEVDEDIHTIARGTVWQSAASIFFKLTSFVYTILIARLVAQEEVGLFYFALGIVSLIGIFADFGITNAIVRYIPYYIGRKDSKRVYHVACVSLLVGTVLPLTVSLIMFLMAGRIAAFFENPALERVLALFAVHISLLQTFNILSSFLIAFRKVKEVAVASNVQNFAKLLLTLAFILSLGASASVLAVAYMLSFFICGIYLLSEAYKIIGGLPTPKNEKPTEYLHILREIAPFGMTMILVLFIWNVVGYTDRIMLGYFLKEGVNQQIAIYSIATGLASIIGIFSTTVINIFYPVVSELVGRKQPEKIRKTSGTALKWVLFTSVPIAAFLMAFAGPMLRLLYGADYESGALCLALFSIGTFASLAGTPQRTALAGMRLLKVEIIVVGITAVVNLLLNIVFVPLYGITGAALASAIALVGMAILNQYYATKFVGFRFPLSAWKNLLAGLMVLAFLFMVAWIAYTPLVMQAESGGLAGFVLDKAVKLAYLLVFFAIGAVFYLVLLNLMRLFEHEDAIVLRRMLQRGGVPKWAEKLLIRTLFWNQKEIH